MRDIALVIGYLVALIVAWFATTTVPALIIAWVVITVAWSAVLIATDIEDGPPVQAAPVHDRTGHAVRSHRAAE